MAYLKLIENFLSYLKMYLLIYMQPQSSTRIHASKTADIHFLERPQPGYKNQIIPQNKY